MSDFHHFPSQEEVGRLDARWVDDMQLMHSLYAFQKNPDPIKRIFDEAMAHRNAAEGNDGFSGFGNIDPRQNGAIDIPPGWINKNT